LYPPSFLYKVLVAIQFVDMEQGIENLHPLPAVEEFLRARLCYFPSFAGRIQMAADMAAHAAPSTDSRRAKMVPGFIKMSPAPNPATQLHPRTAPSLARALNWAEDAANLPFDFGELWKVFQLPSSTGICTASSCSCMAFAICSTGAGASSAMTPTGSTVGSTSATRFAGAPPDEDQVNWYLSMLDLLGADSDMVVDSPVESYSGI
jgi:hypothetical protein